MNEVFIGFDPREAEAFAVCRRSIRRYNRYIPIRGLVLDELRAQGLYSRPTERRDGRLIDVLSIRDDYDGAMSTEFAISRFLALHLQTAGWATVMDCDMLVRANIARAAERLDPKYAVYVVKHDHRPANTRKMDDQPQTQYPRKNWSSLMLLNRSHPSNRALTLEMINTRPGRDLHAFCWLKDDEIGELDPAWNFLVGHSDPSIEPKIVHFTDGIPSIPGYEHVPYADEWRAERARWAA